MSGRSKERPKLQRLLDDLQAGDMVVVKSLDRLSRSTKDMPELVEVIKGKKATLQIPDMKPSKSTTQGEFFLTILARTAEKYKGRKKS